MYPMSPAAPGFITGGDIGMETVTEALSMEEVA